MNCFGNECMLSEKKLNMLSNVDKNTAAANSITYIKSLATSVSTNVSSTTKHATPEKRLNLTKTYSCSDAMSPNMSGQFTFITPRQFVELIAEGTSTYERKSFPIVDCRSQIDFGHERVRSSHNVNCRAKIMARKLISKRLEDVEPSLTSPLSSSDVVILYDQSTEMRGEEKVRSSPINLVIQAAKKSNKTVHIIQGGFEAIKTQYPHLIECSTEEPKEKHEQDHAPPTPDMLDKENFTMTEILPHIFVGNIHDAQNSDRLNQNGITHIINSTPDIPCFWQDGYQYLRIDVLDLPNENIRKHFDTIFQFIDDALESKTSNVLVHCSAGISRSPTLVLAYMIKKCHLALDEALSRMRQLRRIVDPNISFIVQLRDWEKKILLPAISTSSSSSSNIETSDENTTVSCPSARSSTASSYCGSTSKSKTEKKPRAESAIIVN